MFCDADENPDPTNRCGVIVEFAKEGGTPSTLELPITTLTNIVPRRKMKPIRQAPDFICDKCHRAVFISDDIDTGAVYEDLILCDRCSGELGIYRNGGFISKTWVDWPPKDSE